MPVEGVYVELEANSADKAVDSSWQFSSHPPIPPPLSYACSCRRCRITGSPSLCCRRFRCARGDSWPGPARGIGLYGYDLVKEPDAMNSSGLIKTGITGLDDIL